jgi:hypothetical protein
MGTGNVADDIVIEDIPEAAAAMGRVAGEGV